MDSYARRRHREMLDVGTVVALGFNDPQKLGDLKPPKSLDQPAAKAEAGWWEK